MKLKKVRAEEKMEEKGVGNCCEDRGWKGWGKGIEGGREGGEGRDSGD